MKAELIEAVQQKLHDRVLITLHINTENENLTSVMKTRNTPTVLVLKWKKHRGILLLCPN